MTPYAQLPTHKPEEFMRTVGLSQEDFLHLHGKLAAYLDEQKALNPLTRRGRKDSKLTQLDLVVKASGYSSIKGKKNSGNNKSERTGNRSH